MHSIKNLILFLILLGSLTSLDAIAIGNSSISKVSQSTNEVMHPFVIVQESEYANLQALCSSTGREPFRSWKTTANSRSNTTFNESSDIRTRATNYIKIMDGLALSYILTSSQTTRDAYRNKFYDYLKYWNTSQAGNITSELNWASWDASIPPEGAFMATIICMDIMYNDPNTTDAQKIQRTNFNTLLKPAADYTYNSNYSHHFHSHAAARAIWELWTGGATNNTKLDAAVAMYKSAWTGFITEDGVFRETGGYAMARAGDPSRYQKGVFNDVIAYSIDNTWYSNPVMSKFYNWLAGYALAPNRYMWPIGDSSYAPFSATYNNAFVRAGNFSTEAAGYAEYFQNNQSRPCDLFAYLCMARGPQYPVAVQSKSKIFADGGAYFIQKNGGIQALAGVLSNFKYGVPTVESWGHMHMESNTLNLAAYGEIILRGPGYNGYASAATNANNFGFDFRYVNSAAISNNVAMFDYDVNKSPGTYKNPSWTNEHKKRYGGLGVSGMTNDGLDYATGYTGALSDDKRTINNGSHARHFVSLYPQDGVGGYFITVDELLGSSSTTTGQLYWHPYSAEINYTSANQYEWKIRKKANQTDQIYYSIFMPTTPTNTTQYDGLFADDIQGGATTSFVGKYICNYYTLNTSKQKNVLTMHFPRKSTQTLPAMERIPTIGTGNSSQAAAFAFASGITDFAMESDGTTERTIISPTYDADGSKARGKMVVYRKINGNIAFYFVAKGRSFSNTTSVNTNGFSSDKDIDIYIKNGKAKVTCTSTTNITFYASDINSIIIDNEVATLVSTGNGWVQVSVPVGTHSIEFANVSATNKLNFNDLYKVYSVKGGIYIETPENKDYEIANIKGQIVKAGRCVERKQFIQFEDKGFFIVKFGANSLKFKC